MDSNGESVHTLLKELIKAHYYPNKKDKSVSTCRYTRNARKLCYERLLSHRGGSEEWQRLGFSVFDQLLVKSYEKKIENDSKSADRLDSYVTALRTNCSEDCSNVLRLLLELAESGEQGPITDGSHLASLRKGTEAISKSLNVARKHSYDQFSRFVFEDTEDLTRHKNVFKGFDSKLFELCPGFVSYTERLSCNMYPSQLQDTVAPSLFGALSHPLKDPWRLDARLEFPELTDESPSLRISDLRSFVQVDVPSKMDLKSHTPMDEDEGFAETMTDTPSSVRSFGCLASVDNKIDVFNIALDELDCGSTKDRYATWESFGCYCPPLEKPLLTEAGSKAFDEVLLCYQHEMSIIHPDLSSIMPKSTIISVVDLFRDAINVLIGVSSKTFAYKLDKDSFVLANVTVSGLSHEAVCELLIDFAECGTAYCKLDSKCKASARANSLVQRAFCNAIDCYLRCYQSSILAIKDRNTANDSQLKLLRLGESTSKLRSQLRLVTDLVFDKSGTMVSRELPAGIDFLRHLYNAVQSCGGDEDRSVFLSFFIAASEPYIRYLCLWAFEGQRFDPYDEFPIVKNIEAHEERDEIFWKESFALVDVIDPLLGDVLNGVFTCGKSLHLLQLCCPKHALMASCELSPCINIAFSEEKQQKQSDHNVRYYNMIKSKVESLALNQELKKILLEKDKEELLHRAQQVSQNTLLKLERDRIHRLEIEREKKRAILADLKAQIEMQSKKKEADRQNVLNDRGFLEEEKGLHVEPVAINETTNSQTEIRLTEETVEIVDDSKSTSSEKEVVGSSEKSTNLNSIVDLKSVTCDSNMNLLQQTTPVEATLGDIFDWNANKEDNLEVVEKSDIVLRPKDVLSSHAKGIKRKQDRDSIDFETGGIPRRPPKTEQGVLVEGSTFMVLRTRGRGAHGHASDSTIQKLIYGGGTASSIVSKPPTGPSLVVATECENGSLHLKNINCCSTISKVQPYTIVFPELDQPPMEDIFTHSKVDESVCNDDVSLASLFRQPLSVILNECLVSPLQAQMRCVDSCLLDFFLTNLKAEEHLSALRDYFFMQNGEFAQMLCDLLFERLAACSSPRKLLNPVVFNSILSRAIALSHPNPYSDNLGFVVKYLPKTFQPNSPSSLNCLRLSYRVDWPLNLLISSDHLVSYERIFSFILQIRRCSWSLTNLYSVLKHSDKQYGLTSSPQFRRFQFFRHEMHHFIRSLYEYIGVQAFQVTWFKLQEAFGCIKNFEQLLEIHSKYLRQILFRCLLHNKGTPIMKIVQDIFSIILKFCSRLLSHRWKRNSTNGSMEVECFPQIQASFKAFQEHTTFLYKVISKLVQRGFQTHLQELLLSLDFNDYYSSLASQSPDVSCPSSLLSSTDISFKSLP